MSIYLLSFNIPSHPKSHLKPLILGDLLFSPDIALFRLFYRHTNTVYFTFFNWDGDMWYIFCNFNCRENFPFSLFSILTDYAPDSYIISELNRLNDESNFNHIFTQKRFFLQNTANQPVFRSRRIFCTFGVMDTKIKVCHISRKASCTAFVSMVHSGHYKDQDLL